MMMLDYKGGRGRGRWGGGQESGKKEGGMGEGGEETMPLYICD